MELKKIIFLVVYIISIILLILSYIYDWHYHTTTIIHKKGYKNYPNISYNLNENETINYTQRFIKNYLNP